MARRAINPVPESDPRTITAAEVHEWSAHARKPWPSEACTEIATRLTLMRWKGDPPDPPDSPWMPKQEAGPDLWWDFQGATDAANTLLASAPAMLRHWDQMRWAPETRGGYEAIESLRDALVRALPCIEWPFGEYKRQGHRNKPRRSPWHMPAVVIAGIVSSALRADDRRAPSFARDSPATRVLHKALARIGYYVETNTIATYLTRRAAKFRKTT